MISCDRATEAISAHLDGEDAPADDHQLQAHLAACAKCHAFAQHAPALMRRLRLHPVDQTVPDHTDEILSAIDASAPSARRRRRRPAGVRAALATVALVQLGMALPALALPNAGMSGHVARELAAFEVALAVGLLVAALRPVHALGLLPMVATLGVLLAAAAAFDVGGPVSLVDELGHLSQFVGIGLLWVLARRQLPRLRARLRAT